MTHRGRPPAWNEEQREQVLELAAEGATQREIAEIVFGDVRYRGRVERIVHSRDMARTAVVREIAEHPSAAVVLPRYDAALGRTATTLIDHKLLFCRIATEDEAHYVTAMLNSTPMQNLLRSFASSVGLTPRALGRLPIPPYEPERHAPLVAAAKAARTTALSSNATSLADAEARVDALVIQALDVSST